MSDEFDPRKCMCGSGLEKWPLYDASGTFCTYVCDKCEGRRRREFDPRIFSQWYDPREPDVFFREEE